MSVKITIMDIGRSEEGDVNLYERELPIDDLFYYDEDADTYSPIKEFTIAANDEGSVDENGKQIDFICSMTMRLSDKEWLRRKYGIEIAQVLIDTDMVAMAKRNDLTKEDILIHKSTKGRKVYDFGYEKDLSITKEERKNIDVSTHSRGPCVVVDYKKLTNKIAREAKK